MPRKKMARCWAIPVSIKRGRHQGVLAGGECLWALPNEIYQRVAHVYYGETVPIDIRTESLAYDRAWAYRLATSSQLMMLKKFLTYSARLFWYFR